MMKIIREKKHEIKKFIFLNLGLLIAAFSAAIYLTPGQIPAGGMYSLALVIDSLFHFRAGAVGAIAFILNVPILVWSWYSLGKEATVKISYSSLLFPLFLSFTEKLLNWFKFDVSNPNMIAATLIGSLTLSLGMAIAIASGGNTGGSDTIGQILHKYFPNSSLGLVIGGVNFLIMAIAAIALGVGNALLGIVAILIVTFTLDRFLSLINKVLFKHNIK